MVSRGTPLGVDLPPDALRVSGQHEPVPGDVAGEREQLQRSLLATTHVRLRLRVEGADAGEMAGDDPADLLGLGSLEATPREAQRGGGQERDRRVIIDDPPPSAPPFPC